MAGELVPENVDVKVGSLLHVAGDDQEWVFRAKATSGDTLFVVAASGDDRFAPPPPGTEVHVSWNIPPSRYLIDAVFVGPVSPTAAEWELRATSEPKPSTRRSFFRGGGGEDIMLRAVGSPLWNEARVVNLSEGGVRFRCVNLQPIAGETIEVQIALGDDLVEASGMVLSAKEIARREYEAVISYELGEKESQQVRQYLMTWQLEQRRRERDDW
ncbi:hypothetical protein ODJ79_18380 [Actinoplanes sp. KI2]|uniref:hypothetical protein n=1 Tax=Actinoplanes sp. KI2 TaxID=2983315 RepID=UPI0021D592E8|nr:hypothetical protein [Actinoplanes sp. KI2]MCU7725700.1 hypothetical protein [Actinoplanes sp. KI2]